MNALTSLPDGLLRKNVAKYLRVRDLLQLSRCNKALRSVVFAETPWLVCQKQPDCGSSLLVVRGVGDDCRDCHTLCCRSCIAFYCPDCTDSSCGCRRDEFPDCAVCGDELVFCSECATHCCECQGLYCPQCQEGNECVGCCNYCGERPCSSACGGEGNDDMWCHVCLNYFCAQCKEENKFYEGLTFYGPCEACQEYTCHECIKVQCSGGNSGEDENNKCLNMLCNKCCPEEREDKYLCKVHNNAAGAPEEDDKKPAAKKAKVEAL
ncbi:expressed unknown protein [Seminavis robusta]|uniref:F-box domain-containing protein n=1 Tax=Seminavis robusta TaxID=568900 RepID=A0A9N8EK77_9STRA|nr:expressed unknown protein [Seminavis robusta]|eukprot:Sro1283_g259060.1 n/a (265) ;mRNA; f:4385-5179